MRSLTESKARWDETLRHSPSYGDLQRAVKFNGPGSPCIAGCRSLCWKTFLLFQNASSAEWSHILRESRSTYDTLREHYLRYIKHPELLAELTLDPLADDPDSPWDTFRRDDTIRAEIAQDVRRLPDEPSFYHLESTQTLILDVLFIYCKLNPDVGGYRQGMHELLAPIVYVLFQDAIDPAAAAADPLADPFMLEMLDAAFLEHDAFALFSRIMDRAKAFYEISSSPNGGGAGAPAEQSAIVEMSRRIHEVTLMKVDPELATHLKNIEILPQIFLIRWVRLLFGREFPFDQLLVLWDTIFAFDPGLDLIFLVCVAMLIRIRWTLLEADYSVALQLLLKYPPPQPPHGPHTFVDDAVYLRDHLNTAGGANLILKYTGKSPSSATAAAASSSRPSTPTTSSALASLGLRQRTLGAARSSPLALASPAARFIQNRDSVEALFQGAAKGVIERGERLGINQAVRDAVGEIRRNMQQGFQEARNSMRVAAAAAAASPSRTSAAGRRTTTVADMERRNRQLASMLDETVVGLKSLATAVSAEGEVVKDGGDNNSKTTAEAIELAAAKIQFIKVYLEDAGLSLPEDEPAAAAVAALSPPLPTSALPFASGKESSVAPTATVAVDTTPVVMMSTPAAATVMASSAMAVDAGEPLVDNPAVEGDRMDMDENEDSSLIPKATASSTSTTTPSPKNTRATPTPVPLVPTTTTPATRPSAPIPTRSTLAQSSFAWMLDDPDTVSSSHSHSHSHPHAASSSAAAAAFPSSSSSSSSPGGSHASSSNSRKAAALAASSRERNAFLFGEVTTTSSVNPLDPGGGGGGGGGGAERRKLTSDEIFGLEPLRKALPKSRGV